MAKTFCESCQKESNFLPIYMAQRVAGVSRSTIYYWLEHGWVHYLVLPSGRRVICEASLAHSASSRSDLALDASPPKESSKPVPPPRNL
jgi:hypothetical protein